MNNNRWIWLILAMLVFSINFNWMVTGKLRDRIDILEASPDVQPVKGPNDVVK